MRPTRFVASYQNATIDRVGTRQEVAEAWHDGCRLVTLVGPRGIGKTRLAVDILERHPDPPSRVHLLDEVEDVAGANDDLWPSCSSVRAITTALQNAGHSMAYPADAGICYEDAGHSLTFAGSPTTAANFARTPQGWLALGGAPKGIAAAQRDAFNRRRTFLRTVSRAQ